MRRAHSPTSPLRSSVQTLELDYSPSTPVFEPDGMRRRHGAQFSEARPVVDRARTYRSSELAQAGTSVTWDHTLDETGDTSVRNVSIPTAMRSTETLLGRGSNTQWRPSENIQDNQSPGAPNVDLAILQALNALADKVAHLGAQQQPDKPERTFSGKDFESPIDYIRALEDWFRAQGTPSNKKVPTAVGTLRDEAQKWAQEIVGCGIEWEAFRNRFLDRYDAVAVRTKLRQKLYGQYQKSNECVANFITYKYNLFKRLEPYTSPNECLAVIQELLNPEVRAYTRFMEFDDAEKMIDLVSRVEKDISESRARTGSNRRSQRPPADEEDPPLRQQPPPRQQRDPPSPCRHCGGNHYNRECPESGNGDRAGGSATARP